MKTFLKSKIRDMWQWVCSLPKHVSFFREVYVWPLFGAFVLWLAVTLVNVWTGRPILDSPDAIVGGLYNLILILLVASIVGACKGHILPDVDEQAPGVSWQLVAVDAASTIIPLCVLSYFVLH